VRRSPPMAAELERTAGRAERAHRESRQAVSGLEQLGRIAEGGQEEAVHLPKAVPNRFGAAWTPGQSSTRSTCSLLLHLNQDRVSLREVVALEEERLS
jgi:hypothetical protein